tara:strand:- start:56 stop:328 length:273 start_codon:yes stop_codon:yes gene_type:complete
MNVEVRVLALTNNNYIISQVDEVATEDIGQPDCKLTKPYIVNTESGKTILEPFMLDLTSEEIFMMGSDKILTLAIPTPKLLEQYLNLIKE